MRDKPNSTSEQTRRLKHGSLFPRNTVPDCLYIYTNMNRLGDVCARVLALTSSSPVNGFDSSILSRSSQPFLEFVIQHLSSNSSCDASLCALKKLFSQVWTEGLSPQYRLEALHKLRRSIFDFTQSCDINWGLGLLGTALWQLRSMGVLEECQDTILMVLDIVEVLASSLGSEYPQAIDARCQEIGQLICAIGELLSAITSGLESPRNWHLDAVKRVVNAFSEPSTCSHNLPPCW